MPRPATDPVKAAAIANAYIEGLKWMADTFAVTGASQRRLYLDIVHLDGGVPVRVGSRTVAWSLVGVAAVLIVLVVGAVLWWRRRRGRSAAESELEP